MKTRTWRSAILRFASGAIGTVSVSDSIASPMELGVHVRARTRRIRLLQQSTYFIGGSEGSLSVPDLAGLETPGRAGLVEPDAS